MDKEIYSIEGIGIEVEKIDKTDADAVRRKMAYAFKMLRAQSGMNRKDFSAWLGIPYRTMQEWELGRRAMPEYVLRLIAYKVQMEKERIDGENELKNLQREFTELTEYLNKLEPSYNQSLEYINHLEEIISRVVI